MSGSKCCFLITHIQASQEAGKVVWYSHLFKNFPQFVVIHTVKDFSLVDEAEVDVFLELSCFAYDPTYVALAGIQHLFHNHWLPLSRVDTPILNLNKG